MKEASLRIGMANIAPSTSSATANRTARAYGTLVEAGTEAQGIDLLPQWIPRLAPHGAPTPAWSSRWTRGSRCRQLSRQQFRSDRAEEHGEPSKERVHVRRAARRRCSCLSILASPGAAQVDRSQAPRPLRERHRRSSGRPPRRLQRVVRARRLACRGGSRNGSREGWCPICRAASRSREPDYTLDWDNFVPADGGRQRRPCSWASWSPPATRG